MTVARLGVRLRATGATAFVAPPVPLDELTPATLDKLARTALDAMLRESAWQAIVIELARHSGWRWWHDNDSRGSDASWPDLALWRDRLLFLELKTQRGRLTVDTTVRNRHTGRFAFRRGQAQTICEMLDAGVEIYVVRPSDFPSLAALLAPGCAPNLDLLRRTRAEAEARIAAARRKGVAS